MCNTSLDVRADVGVSVADVQDFAVCDGSVFVGALLSTNLNYFVVSHCFLASGFGDLDDDGAVDACCYNHYGCSYSRGYRFSVVPVPPWAEWVLKRRLIVSPILQVGCDLQWGDKTPTSCLQEPPDLPSESGQIIRFPDPRGGRE